MKLYARTWYRSLFVGLLLVGILKTPARADSADSYRLSYQLEAKGDFKGALARMRDIRNANGATYFISLRSGWLSYLAGDLAGAETQYREAIAAKPAATEAKIGLSSVLLAGQKWSALQTVCKQILADDPKHAIVRARLAAAHYASGNYPESATVYRKLMDEYPGDLDHQTGYGWALQRMGKRDEAQKVFQAVLAVSPDNVNAKQGVAAK